VCFNVNRACLRPLLIKINNDDTLTINLQNTETDVAHRDTENAGSKTTNNLIN